MGYVALQLLHISDALFLTNLVDNSAINNKVAQNSMAEKRPSDFANFSADSF